MQGSEIGFLTALPALIFGLVGMIAVRLAQWRGITEALMIALIVMIVGLGIRPWVNNSWTFILFSALGLAGIAVANVLIPAWIKIFGRSATVHLFTLYSMTLVASGTMATLSAAPLAKLFQADGTADRNWQAALFSWSVPAVFALIIWLVVVRHTRHQFLKAPVSDTPGRPIYKSPMAWALTGLFGLQSMSAYIQFGWLPQVYRDAGVDADTAGFLLASVTSLGVLGGLIFPTIVERSQNLTGWIIFLGVAMFTGYIGLSIAPASLGLLWAILLGIGGMAFPLAITLIAARSRSPHVTAQLSGFVQPVGYVIAGTGPFLVGVMYEQLGNWDVILYFLASTAVIMTACALVLARPKMVDDELAA